MTRRVPCFRQLEVLESKGLLSPVPTVLLPLATVASVPPTNVSPVPMTSLSLRLATVVSVTPTNGSPTPGGVYGTVFGSYGHTARSLLVHAQGNAALLGHVNVKGKIALSGPNSDTHVDGLLTLTGRQGSLQIQVEANNAVMTPGGMTVSTTETVVEATGSDTAIQGETGNGTLELGNGTRTIHLFQGGLLPAHKFFSLSFTVNPPIA